MVESFRQKTYALGGVYRFAVERFFFKKKQPCRSEVVQDSGCLPDWRNSVRKFLEEFFPSRPETAVLPRRVDPAVARRVVR